jgi:hypothetical protein
MSYTSKDENLLCTCGHTLIDHHISYLMGGSVWVEECEFYGFNESSGMKQDENGQWIVHCMKFTPVKEKINGN